MLTLSINGREHRFDGDPEMPLLWYLRDILNLTGSKYGCGMALCGACTVHLDGRAARACITPLRAVGNARVTTIEGLSDTGTHPLQQAWMALNVAQCGYCQCGQIMQAASLLAENPRPDEAAIATAMAGNLCRCGTYTRIREAIQLAANTMGAAA